MCPRAAPGESLPIVGRDAELDELTQLLGDVRGGASRAVVVEGEPGIGKTRLIEEVYRRAADAGMTILRGTGEELRRDRPFGLFIDALALDRTSPEGDRPHLAELVRTSEIQASDRRYQIVEGIEDVVEHEAMRRPVLLLAEDVHWADTGSVLALHHLLRRDDLALLLVLTCRSVPRSDELRRLIDAAVDRGGHHVKLGPLPSGAVEELAESRLQSRVGPRLLKQLSRAAGNPLFVVELLGGLSEEHVIELRDGIAETAVAVEPPPSLRTLIVRRLGFLSRESVELLRTAAVLGESFSAADLAAVTDMPLRDVLAALNEPLSAGFVSADEHRFTFRHDVVREALYSDIAPALRKAMHLHAARALADAGVTPERFAEHAALGAEPGDRQAIDWLQDAAIEIGARSPTTAARLRRRAAELLPADDPTRLNLLMPAVHHLATAGHIDEASALAEELAPVVQGTPVQIMLDLQRLNLLVVQVRMDEVEAYTRRLLADPSLDPVNRFQIRTIAVGVRAILQNHDALNEIDEVRPFAAANPNSGPAAMVNWIDGFMCYMRGRFAHAVEEFEAAVPGTGIFIGGRGQGLQMLGVAQALADMHTRAPATVEAARQELERRGMVQYLVENHWVLGVILFVAGRWDDALAEITASRELVAETGAQGTANAFPDPVPLIHSLRGDAAGAERSLAQFDSEPNISGGLFRNWTEPMRAIVCEAGGNRGAALSVLRAWRQAMDDLGFVPDFRTIGRTLVRIARDDDELLERIGQAAQEALSANDGVKSVEGAALVVSGAISGDAETLLAGVDAARAGGRCFDIAEACAEAAVALARSGRGGDARELADEALRGYEELDARACEAVLRQELRAAGVRPGTRRARTASRHGWDALTETERRVVALVGEGLTNGEIGGRLFISKGTVATHLRSVFRKVGVSSRTELAAEAARRLH